MLEFFSRKKLWMSYGGSEIHVASSKVKFLFVITKKYILVKLFSKKNLLSFWLV